MKELKKATLIRGMIALHFLAMSGLFVGCWYQFYMDQTKGAGFASHDVAVCAVYVMALFILSGVYSVYKVGMVRVGELVYSQVIANLVALGMTYILACILEIKILNPAAGFGVALVQGILSCAWTELADKTYFALHRPKRTVVVYRNEQDLRKLSEIHFHRAHWRVEKMIHWDAEELHDLPYGAEAPSALNDQDIHALIGMIEPYEVVYISGINATLRNGLVKYCVETGKDCFFVPHTGDVITAGATHVRSFSVPIWQVERSIAPETLFFKRLLDVVLSLMALILTAPVMLVTAAAIKVYDGGPAFYKQVRLTKDGKPFEILKFRSMRIDAEKDGVARLATENDSRITPIGKTIRSLRLDELPQLINILRGDMSIVGPRPERPEIAEQYRKELPAFDLRLQVKAGLTGYAQIYGRYNTEPGDKLKMDLMYINRISIAEDFRLMFATVRVLFMKDSTHGVESGKLTASNQTISEEQLHV